MGCGAVEITKESEASGFDWYLGSGHCADARNDERGRWGKLIN